ncbi:hypothetical protein PsYK624_041340 [Phanerochaete sordida]|uniref:Uncharacterized protein n=1 Tax=Phanerochaete sordida TaxID=48140 RepID=A0A9P3G4F0_9APHY|nr:hypothetical protein PsYK624_041340 [Phanerochaete sordida]
MSSPLSWTSETDQLTRASARRRDVIRTPDPGFHGAGVKKTAQHSRPYHNWDLYYFSLKLAEHKNLSALRSLTSPLMFWHLNNDRH